MAKATKKLSERIMDGVSISSDGCWVWQRSVNNAGYGQMTVGSMTDNTRVTALAHRVSYMEFVGDIEAGMTIDHLCKNKLCVNPEHLEVVSYKENSHRSNQYWKQLASRTHCRHGHEYTPENTYRYTYNGSTARKCKKCNSSASSRSWAKYYYAKKGLVV